MLTSGAADGVTGGERFCNEKVRSEKARPDGHEESGMTINSTHFEIEIEHQEAYRTESTLRVPPIVILCRPCFSFLFPVMLKLHRLQSTFPP
jgi:hypothetical protein